MKSLVAHGIHLRDAMSQFQRLADSYGNTQPVEFMLIVALGN